MLSIRKSGPSTTEETESYKFSRDDWEEWIGSEGDLNNLCICDRICEKGPYGTFCQN